MSYKRILLAIASSILSVSPVFSQWKPGEFAAPPDEYKAWTWYHWQNGHIDKDEVKADLKSMKEVGLGGFYLFNSAEGVPPGPVTYMTPRWWDIYRETAAEAERLGLGMGVMNGAGWSVSGGPWVKPEDSMKEVAWTQTLVTGPGWFEGTLPEPLPCLGLERDMRKDPVQNRRYYVPREQVAGHFRDIVVLAFPTPEKMEDGSPYHIKGWWDKAGFTKMTTWIPDETSSPENSVVSPGDIIDLTGRVGPDGSVSWEIPEGEWTILRIGYQHTGRRNHPAAEGGSGLEVDKLSAAAVTRFWEASPARLLEEAGNVSTVLIDSYEAGHQNWTEGFENEFIKRMGYDPRPFLPAVAGFIIGGTQETERFLWDYRKVISDLLNENFYDRFATLCHQSGKKLAIEPYGQFGNTDEFSTGSSADILAGEFWAGESAGSTYRTTVKLASSLSHVYGKEIVGAEAFTNGGRIFEVYPGMLKTQGDYYFCLGMNQVWLHSFVHDPYGKIPGMTLGFYGTHFNRRNTWWKYSRPWFEYLSRCQYMLRQGKSACDILYYMGEDAPSRPPKTEDLVPAIPEGYDYDFCGGSQILSELKVDKGVVTAPGGKSYKIIVVSSRGHLRPAALERMEALSKAGALIYSGTTGKNLEDCLKDNGILPDLEVTFPEGFKAGETRYPGGPVVFTHRSWKSSEVYFISNQQPHTAVDPALLFNVKGLSPEIWNPEDGSVEAVRDYETAGDGRIRVRLHLEESGSAFVVFRNPADGGSPGIKAPQTRAEDSVPVTGPWEVSLLPGLSGEGKSFSTSVLSNLSDSDDPDIRYFSGEIVYRNSVKIRKSGGRRYVLDLGGVSALAVVKINGKEVGTLWHEPYRTDITEYIRKGRNDLEIKVVNLLYNRVAGDLLLPEDREWTSETGSTATGSSLTGIPQWVKDGEDSPTGRKTFTTWDWPYMKDKPLPKSGLLGPVLIIGKT